MGGLPTMKDVSRIESSRTGSGAEECIAALFDKYGPETYGFFRRRTGDPELAAELNQDLYLSALQALGRFRRECSTRTWLFSIAHHRLSRLRARWRTHLDEKNASVPEKVWLRLATEDYDVPEQVVQRTERIRELRRCLAKLSEVHRAVVVGHYYEGTTLEMLTRNLGLTNPSGARAPLIAALRRLRRCLERAGVLATRGAGQGEGKT
jgi:RNA polymerase sigma-70 factor (ECF subfamily)